ncbi:MAG: sugar phosphate isomerase/epimerase family protein [Chloroflexota bacterium]|jgi:sugar phosphate isomerase/epimerase
MTRTSRPRLAFSTLACPEWDAAAVVTRAAAGGWDGVEWRGGPDGTVRTDWTGDRRSALRRAMDGAGLTSVAVTTYPNLISSDPEVIQRSVADAAAHAALARDLGAPAIRVFLGERDDDAAAETLERRAIDALTDLLARIRPLGVTVAVEPHDDHVRSDSLRPILDALPDAALGVVWDIGNAWSVGEDPAVGLAGYAGRIAWVQIKDGTGIGTTWRLCELGAGDVPLDRALSSLAKACASSGAEVPPISLEWERVWDHDLAPAEIALPRAHAWLLRHVGRIGIEG